MARNDGKHAQRLFEAWAEKAGAACYRFEDYSEVNFRPGGGRTQRKIVGARPSDYLITLDAVTFFAEVKSSINKTRFPFGNIEREQWRWARKVTRSRGQYDFFLLNLGTHFWYRVPAAVLLKVFHAGKASISWQDLAAYPWRDMNASGC